MSGPATIIPIAGGKGGIGKSIIAANLAVSLARLGKSVVAVDLDLGGSNLHSYLGLPNTLPSIGDYLKKQGSDFNEYLHPTWQHNLRFLPGDGRTPFLANINYGHKVKLIRNLKTVEADYVLVDLGAGSSFNTLDYFAMSPRGVLVTTTEQPALMGMMVFLKNLVFRVIEKNLKSNKDVCDFLHNIFSQPITAEKITLTELQQRIAEYHPESGVMVNQICHHFRPRLIMNWGSSPDDLANKLEPASRAINKMLSLDVEHFGFVFDDPTVHDAIEAGSPLIDYDPECLAVRCINVIAERIIKLWDSKIEESDKKLLLHTQNMYHELRTQALAGKSGAF
ncbi:MAG: P-loop NTPase [Gammaproteobacteria bacterium]|nr:P-loop NTPase [Gammaproteobacteria bacterium]